MLRRRLHRRGKMAFQVTRCLLKKRTLALILISITLCCILHEFVRLLFSPALTTASLLYGEAGCSISGWRHNMRRLLFRWERLARENDIEYALFFGSLLGVIRDGEVIPYDSDIDVLIDIKYLSRFRKLSVKRGFDHHDGKIRLVLRPEIELNNSSAEKTMFTCRGKLTSQFEDQCSFKEPIARLITGLRFIDFFHFYDKGNKLLDRSGGRTKYYEKDDFFPLKRCLFMGIDSWCPKNPRNLLKIYYGSDNLEPLYTCKNRTWVSRKDGRPI